MNKEQGWEPAAPPEETEETTETPPESGVFDEQPQETEEPPAAPVKKERPPGYEPVDLDELDLPDETKAALQDRIDYLYGQVKFRERDFEALRDHNGKLSEALEKLHGRVNNIEDGKKTDEIGSIKRQIAEAYEEGEYERAVELTEELADLKAAAKAEPEKEEKKPQTSELSPDQEEILTEWLKETDESGEPLHAYADPNHEDHALATGLALKLAKDPIAMSKVGSMGDFLDLLDVQMKKQKSKRAPVSPATTNARPSEKKKTELTQEEKTMAHRMLTHLPPNEREAAYAKQKAAIEGLNA